MGHHQHHDGRDVAGMSTPWVVAGARWTTTSSHQAWLADRTRRLFDFYRRAFDPSGGFFDLDEQGHPMPTGWPPAASPQTSLFQTTRMIHSFGLAHVWGRPDSARMVDHGMEHLWDVHRDRGNGGYFWVNGKAEPLDSSKQIYGHAFVLLAGSTASLAGHPDAARLVADVSEVIDQHFWDPDAGAAAESFNADWSEGEPYRGANGNMHLVESLLAAHEATGDTRYLEKASGIASRIIGDAAAGNDWRIPEHFHENWSVDFDYDRDVFRPYGSTIGHWLEWSRLLLQLWVAQGRSDGWMRDAAVTLFTKAMDEGWDADRGGFYFTVGWDGKPVDRDRYWWPCTEGIGAAYWLAEHVGGDVYESAYRKIWSWSTQHLIDDAGFWLHQLDDLLTPISDPWFGVPDVYHSAQACLIPQLGAGGSVAAELTRQAE